MFPSAFQPSQQNFMHKCSEEWEQMQKVDQPESNLINEHVKFTPLAN